MSQCKAKTSDGEQCTRDAKDGSNYCYQHIEKTPYGSVDPDEETPTESTDDDTDAESESMPDEIDQETRDLLEHLAEEQGQPVSKIRPALEGYLQIDFANVDGADAKEAHEALIDGDSDRVIEFLHEYDVPDDAIMQFQEMVEEYDDPGDQGGDTGSDSVSSSEATQSSVSGSGNDDGLTPAQRQEVAQIVGDKVPSAKDIAAEIQPQGGGGGGGDGGGGNQLAAILAQQAIPQVLGDSDPGPMEEAQQEMMKNMAQMMGQVAGRKPMEMQLGEKVMDGLLDQVEVTIGGQSAESADDEGIEPAEKDERYRDDS